jgi:bromodomain-containing protein 7/9
MKDADPQHVFLNPVTDVIAPGYSDIISKPMSIVTMEQKVANNEYNSITDWEADVKLMYKNCIDYNRGNAGQCKWFRGEANRQGKVYRQEIFPHARRLYQNEIAKRSIMGENSRKRKGEDDVPEISPLAPSTKKRKKEKEEFLPSMPALASMLLSDPFVVRMFLDRVLRELRSGVIGGTTIPMAHSLIPSLLQILQMARLSTQTCAIRGRKYFIPGAGFQESSEDDPAAAVSYATLRRFLPLLLQLMLAAELDRRVIPGGDLHQAAQSYLSLQQPAIDPDDWNGDKQTEVAVALVEGALVSICQPGNRNETSLSVTFPKFSMALQHISVSLLEDRVFFLCLIQALLKHKTKLTKGTCNAIVEAWLQWLIREPSRVGSMTSAAHERLIFLLNEWSALGNVLLPRDKLLQFAKEAVQAADASEAKDERKFLTFWNSGSVDFAPVKKQYDRMLKQLPEASAMQWKEDVGIRTGEMVCDDAKGESN